MSEAAARSERLLACGYAGKAASGRSAFKAAFESSEGRTALRNKVVETERAIAYVRDNYRNHSHEHLPDGWEDPFSSARYLARDPDENAPVALPRTWLLRVGWRAQSMARPEQETAAAQRAAPR